MLRADRELLARIARLNKVLAAIALPLCDDLLTAHDLRTLADEMLALGRQFHDRAANATATDDEYGAERVTLEAVEDPVS